MAAARLIVPVVVGLFIGLVAAVPLSDCKVLTAPARPLPS